MGKKMARCLFVVFIAAALSVSACTPASPGGKGRGETDGKAADGDALTWGTWGSYANHKDFFELLNETYPEVELEFVYYKGGNKTGYSWAQMRADDISDIFITSQIVDEDLAGERLVDLSSYPFINDLSTSVLHEVSIDGGIYLLPTGNSMYGIYYNKTLMDEKGWKVPDNFTELEALCKEIEKEGMIPGVIATQVTGGPFSAVSNLAKTSWLTTPEGVNWERDFLAGRATAEGMWEDTMDYVQRYIDIGMFHVDPGDASSFELIEEYLGGRKAVFLTAVATVSDTRIAGSTDELGMMPYVSEDGSKNVYMYSPTYYFGISRRLAEPGNEKKLEDAVKVMSLLFSPEGQAALMGEDSPCVMGVLDGSDVSEEALLYDARRAMKEGRAFQMTYANWENVLADMGLVFKEWFWGEEGMDGARCIARMDELQQNYLEGSRTHNFCESKADFSLEETAELAGKALGSATGADAVMVPVGEFREDGFELKAGISGRLYAGNINADVVSGISPGVDGEYAMMTMSGAEAKALAGEGFDACGDGDPYPYLLVTRDGSALDDGTKYQVAFFMQGYTEEVAIEYSAEVHEGSLQKFLQDYLREQKEVAPDANPWK